MRLVVLMLLATILTGCSADTSQESTPTSTDESTANTAVSENTADQDSNVFVIDVRSQEEWDTGHVEQATHIPYTEIADRIAEVTDDKDAKIVLYCAAGGRAGTAKSSLESLGFTNVENGGGYDDVKDRFE